MGKRSGKKDRADKARRDLAKAQLDLHTAQEKRVQAITRGEHEVEQARQRAARWLAKATERVERRAGAMARAEARFIAFSASAGNNSLLSPEHAAPDSTPILPQHEPIPSEVATSDPSVAADVVAELQADAAVHQDPGTLVVPESVELNTSPDAPDNNDTGAEETLHPW